MPCAAATLAAVCGLLLLRAAEDPGARASHTSTNSNYGTGGVSACSQNNVATGNSIHPGGACKEVADVPTAWTAAPIQGFASTIDARVRAGEIPDQVFLTAFPTTFDAANKKAGADLQIDNTTNAVGAMGESW